MLGLLLLSLLSGAPRYAAGHATERIRPVERGPAGKTHQALFRMLTSTPALTSQCTGAALAGTKSETVTFTRSGSQTCSKSDGTVVKLSANQPALEARGVLLEAAGTNYLLNSEAFGGAGWTKTGGTITNDFAVAPDVTTTAERYQFTTAIAASCYETVTVPSTTTLTASAFLQQTSANPGGIGTVIADGLSGAQPTCSCSTSDGRACTITTTGTGCGAGVTLDGSWVRVAVTSTFAVAKTSVAGVFRPGVSGSTSTGDMLIWGMQLETLPFASSYIPTAGTTVTRNSTNLNLPNLSLSATPSQALTWTSEGPQALAILSMTGVTGTERLEAYSVDTTGAVACAQITAGNSATSKQHSTAVAARTATRVACYYDGSAIGVCVGGACQTAAATGLSLTAATTNNALGYYRTSASAYASGWLSNICIDSTSGGCR